MRYILQSLIILFILSACKKEDSGSFIWEKEMGTGKLVYVTPTADSMFAACGESDGHPVLYKISAKGKVVEQYKSTDIGMFTSVISDTGGYYVSGIYDSEFTLLRLDKTMTEKWVTKEPVTIAEGQSRIIMESPGSVVAAVSAFTSDYGNEPSPLIFIRIDTAGIVQGVAEKNIVYFNSASSLLEMSGSFYLATMVGPTGGRSKAEVAKYSSDFNLIWNTSLFNNPGFGAGSLSIIKGEGNTLLVSGFTELPGEDEVVINSWVASLSDGGSINWKVYPEVSNSGEGLIDHEGTLITLNRNCMILSMIDPSNGDITGRKRMFTSCDSYKTGSRGLAFSKSYNGNLLVAGERDGNIYMVYSRPE